MMGHDPGFMFLAIYTDELQIYIHTKTCTQIFVAALFIVATGSNQEAL